MMDRQCRLGCKDCWVTKLEIYSHELRKLARTSPEGQGSRCAAISMIMTAKKCNVYMAVKEKKKAWVKKMHSMQLVQRSTKQCTDGFRN